MRIFLDSTTYYNILTSKDGPKLIEKLMKLLKDKDKNLKLVFPKITEFEVSKNKFPEDKVKKDESKDNEVGEEKNKNMKGFSEQEKKEILKKEKEYLELYEATLKERAQKERLIKETLLRKIFEDLKSLAISFDETPEVIEVAFHRRQIGYPPFTNKPGKPKDGMGDCLAWELLLKNCADDDLIIVSFDDDWADFTGSGKIHPILEEEWKKKSGKSIELIKILSDLLIKYKVKVSKKEKDDEEKTAIKTQTFPYSFPVRYAASSASGPNPSAVWELVPANASAASISWGSMTSLPTPSITSTTTSSSGTTLGSLFGKICKNCGKSLSYSDNFCSYCGTKSS